MKRLAVKNSAAVAAMLMALVPSLASADSGHAYITGTNPTVLKVKSNGQAYTKLDLLGNFSVSAKLKFDTGVTGRIKSWKAEPVMINGYGIATPVQGTSAYKQSKSYSVGHRPKSINKNLVFSMPSSMIKNAAVAMCNWRANTLRDQGKSNQQIFSQNQEVHFNVQLKASVDSMGPGRTIKSGKLMRRINSRCGAANGPGRRFLLAAKT